MESIIREAVSRLGLKPDDPDYVSLVSLLRRMVIDVRSGRLSLGDVDGFFEEIRDMIENLIELKGLGITVDDAVKTLSTAVKTAASSSGSNLLLTYMRYVSRRSGSGEEEGEKETDRVI